MGVTIHEAKTQLSRLIAAGERGEEVIISRRDKPVARLVGAEPPAQPQRKLGFLKGYMSPELVDFLTNNPALDKEIEEDFDAWEKELLAPSDSGGKS